MHISAAILETAVVIKGHIYYVSCNYNVYLTPIGTLSITYEDIEIVNEQEKEVTETMLEEVEPLIYDKIWDRIEDTWEDE